MLTKWLFTPVYTLIILSLLVLGLCACCCCCFCLCLCVVRKFSKRTCRGYCRAGSRYQPLELPNDQAALNSPEEQNMTEMNVFMKSDSLGRSDQPVYLVPPQQYQYAMIVPPKGIDENTSEV